MFLSEANLKRPLMLFTIFFLGMMIIGCEEKPQYYNRYMPLNDGNYWVYWIEDSNEDIENHFIYYYVVELSDSDKKDGDTWKLLTRTDIWSYVYFPTFIRNKGIGIYVRRNPNWSQSGSRSYTFLLSDPEEIGNSEGTGFFFSSNMIYQGYVDYTVSAGEFSDVMKIYCHHVYSPQEPEVHTYEEYYAPDVGLIYSHYSSVDHEFSAELVDYHINPR